MTEDNQEKNYSSQPENLEIKSERKIISFEDYAEVCNHTNDSSRRRGILSAELYEDIIADTGTDLIRFGDSYIPALIDIKFGLALGYDASRCRKYAEGLSENIKVLTLPFHELDQTEQQQIVDYIRDNGGCSLYFSDHGQDESDALSSILAMNGIKFEDKPILDPRAAKGDEQAGLFLYSLSTEQYEDRGERTKKSVEDVQDYYDKNFGPSYNSEGSVKTILELGDRVPDDEAEELWALYDSKFDYLGEDHPISMQDTKEEFFELLRSKSTIVAATYIKQEGGPDKLACFTYFIDNIDRLFWLNNKFLDNNCVTTEDAKKFTTDIFTPGLVSSGEGATYSSLPISLFSKVCDEVGLSGIIMYENTNLSKRYIPRIVDRAISRSCTHMIVRPSVMIDKVDFRLWSIESSAE